MGRPRRTYSSYGSRKCLVGPFLIGVCTFTFFCFLRTIQAIYIPENQQFLQICNSIDWNWNECFDTKPLDLNQWHTIKLLQRKGIEVILYDSYDI